MRPIPFSFQAVSSSSLEPDPGIAILMDDEAMSTPPATKPKSSEKSCKEWCRSAACKIYVCHTFSSWGDRMWGFGVGLYMVILYPDSLLLTAIYGFANCLSGILLGSYIGRWIDRSQRITAARVSILVQNGAVVLGATLLTLTLHYRDQVKSHWRGGLEYLLFALIILLAIVAELASVANKIALEKDWIVVLSGGDEKALARLNSTMRTINLTTFILAPIAVGQIISSINPEAGAISIAVWNILSAVVEYCLLNQIYKSVPQLGSKKVEGDIPFDKISEHGSSGSRSGDDSSRDENVNIIKTKRSSKKDKDDVPDQPVSENGEIPLEADNEKLNVPPPVGNGLSPGPEFENVSLRTPTSAGPLSPNDQPKHKGCCDSCRCSLCDGWKVYFGHHVKYAGFGLASLYMTVLGFDSITSGFIYSQGVKESFIGILTAIGAVFGIAGSLCFPYFRKRFGKNTTGVLGFSLETLSLLFCVASVFTLGSPFAWNGFPERFHTVSGTDTSNKPEALSIMDIWDKELHVVLLLIGIIVARFGLWLADLSVTQIFQEEVEEHQRGVINGVQDSINKFMDLIKYTLVILLPAPKTFGLLIFISWFFVFLGLLSFITFIRKEKIRIAKLKKVSPAIPTIALTTV